MSNPSLKAAKNSEIVLLWCASPGYTHYWLQNLVTFKMNVSILT